METSKKVSESRTEISHLMMPSQANFGGNVFGGTILSIADGVAYVCAARHAGPYCVTVSVDRVDFHEAIKIGELVTFKASINYAGRTSMEVGIKIFAENLKTGEKRHTNTCYFTMVALDETGKPKEVPTLVLETDDDRRRFREGEERRRIARDRLKKKP